MPFGQYWYNWFNQNFLLMEFLQVRLSNQNVMDYLMDVNYSWLDLDQTCHPQGVPNGLRQLVIRFEVN